MKTKPFPWKCFGCREATVYPSTVDYTTTIEHDGRSYSVRIPALEVPQCRNCGKLVMTDAANGRVSEAFRREAGLLTPGQIRRNREALGMTQKQLAGFLGIAEATLSRWETGGQVQQRSLDRFLRIVFGFPEVRAVLADDRRLASLSVAKAIGHAAQTITTTLASAIQFSPWATAFANLATEAVVYCLADSATEEQPQEFKCLARSRYLPVGG